MTMQISDGTISFPVYLNPLVAKHGILMYFSRCSVKKQKWWT
jgi:hypothetical protein